MSTIPTGSTLSSELDERPTHLPAVTPPRVIDNRSTRQFIQDGYTVNVDLSRQILHIEAPKEIDVRRNGQFLAGDLVRLKRNSSLLQPSDFLTLVNQGRYVTVHRVHGGGERVDTSVIVDGHIVRGSLSVDEIEFVASTPVLHSSLKHLSPQEFASAGVLEHKAKQFDDGLMAAVQQSAQEGRGKFVGKAALLERLAKRLSAKASGNVVLAACELGKVVAQIPSANKSAVDSLVAEFLANPVRSKPISIYTWNQSLSAVFQQDRMLQTDLTKSPGIDALVIARALQSDTADRRAYEACLRLQSRLTNPPAEHAKDLRPLLAELDAGRTPQVPAGIRFFPQSSNHECDLLKKMFPDGVVPDNFQLMEELVRRVKLGSLDLTPRPDSGWYDWQIWSLEPYVRPHRMPEGSRWSANDDYHEHLARLFQGGWALSREVHIKDLEICDMAICGSDDGPSDLKIPILIQPQLSAEPVATSFLRRALGYRFVRNVLTEQFGDESLKQMYRLTVNGPVTMNLDDELRQMEALFHGAYVTVTRQLGLVEKNDVDVGSAAGAEVDVATFMKWAENLDRDPDLSADIRMMVPLSHDPVRNRTKAWAFLGWMTSKIYVSFNEPPAVSVCDQAGKLIDPDRLEIIDFMASYTVATPVFHELYVSMLLNRDEFRAHCDAYGSAEAILRNLESDGMEAPFHGSQIHGRQSCPGDFCIRMLAGPKVGEAYQLSARTVVGRDLESDVCVTSQRVSRRAFVLVWNEDWSCHVIDDGWHRPNTPVYVNLECIGEQERVPLSVGDQITVGDTTFVYERSTISPRRLAPGEI